MKRAALAVISAVVAFSPVSAGTVEADPAPVVVVPDAKFPTNMAFSPDGRLFYNEKDTGDIRVVKNGKLLPEPFARLDVTPSGETGLLGLVLDPSFDTDPWVYVYYSDAASGHNRLIRIRANGDVGTQKQDLVTFLSTEAGYHNGGDIAFGPDGRLYVTVGEVHEDSRAQDPNDLGGKVLRYNPDGSIPADNPLGPDNAAFSMGHRNSFGICFDPANGQLYETENGPDSHDEINRIEAGGNYGWPAVMGPGGESGFVDPILDFPEVIVPTGCAVWNGDLYFGDMNGNVRRWSIGKGLFGGDVVYTLPSGVTDLQVGPDGRLWAATTDTIVTLGSESPATPTRRSPEQSSRVASNHFETYAAWAAGIVALIVVVLGGLWFRRLSREGDQAGRLR